MKTFRMAVLAIGLATLFASQASAQGGRGMMGMMGGGGPALLTNKSILKEIKADEKQTEALAKVAEDLQAKQREAFAGLQDLSQEERREKMTELNKTMTAEISKAIKENLKEEQAKRFQQCRIQSMGPRAFMDAETSKELKVTDEQKEKIQELMMDMGAQMREIFQSAGDDREGAMKKMAEMNKEMKEKIIAMMTADQKKAWEALAGAPFEFVPEMPARRN